MGPKKAFQEKSSDLFLFYPSSSPVPGPGTHNHGVTFSELFLVAAQVIVVLALVVVAGRAAARAVRQDAWGAVEEVALGVGAFVAFAVGLLLLHVVTGGFIFRSPWPVPLIAAGLFVVCIKRVGLPRLRFERRRWLAFAAFGLVLFALFVTPMVASGSSLRTGDPPWHLGWTEQLLGGERLPSGPAPEFARNAYPWGHHAILATMSRLVPGATAMSSHDALQVLLVLAIPLAAAALARAVDRRAGWPAAVAVSLIGGWGFLRARSAAFDASPREARFGADLVVASPNSLYELFPPALPREVGLVLLGIFGALLLRCAPGTRGLRLAAGVVLGLIGLVSFPMALHGGMWVGVALLLREGRRGLITDVVLPAAVIFGAWAGPVAFDAFRYGGLVNVSPALGREWPVLTSLSSWGLLLPFALMGLVLLLRRRDERARLLVAIVGASLLLLAVALVRKSFEGALSGQSTLLHQGRMWPALHLLAAVAAGVAAAWVWPRLLARSRVAAAAVTALVLMVGVASPLLASMGLTRIMQAGREGFVYGVLDLSPDAFIRQAAAHMDPDEVALVEGSGEIAFLLFQLSGVRLAAFDDPRLQGNDLRIRFEDLAARYEERMAGGGFDPDWVVLPGGGPALLQGREATPILSGSFRSEDWTLYRVDR